jgi:hypothetical protein
MAFLAFIFVWFKNITIFNRICFTSNVGWVGVFEEVSRETGGAVVRVRSEGLTFFGILHTHVSIVLPEKVLKTPCTEVAVIRVPLDAAWVFPQSTPSNLRGCLSIQLRNRVR